MAKIPRDRERTATPTELEEDRRRCLAAKAKAPTPASIEGNLCAALVRFAAWRPCRVCGSLTLYVNENVRTDSDFECGRCKQVREILARWLRPSLPMRAAVHLLGLFSTAIDNREVAHAS
jgi:hypothetical protein